MKINEHILSQINIKDSDKNDTDFANELMQIYTAENKLLLLFPKMIKNAKSVEIEAVLKNHLKFIQEHQKHIKNLFLKLNKPLNP